MAPGGDNSISQQLPQRENALFKRIVKSYEQKQYKNGLKFSKQILSNPKFSDHGETLCMKGLILNCLGRRDEASEFIQRGLRSSVKSHVCWHVYGLLRRSEKRYDDAIKAYLNALKLDKDNIQILRDLSLLQIQMRDMEGYKDTRYTLFQLRPTQRASWINYAMAHHLLKDYDFAYRLVEEFRKTQNVPSYDFEYSELLLYQNMILREAERYEEALNHLNKFDSDIGDRRTVHEVKAFLYKQLGKHADAGEIYLNLTDRNPDNVSYYHEYENAVGAESWPMDKRLSFYAKKETLHKRAFAPVILPLKITLGSTFKEYVDKYLKNSFRKGIPPVFNTLRDIFRHDKEKLQVIEDMILGYEVSLVSNARFEPDGPTEAPTVILWVYYYLAQHFDYLGRPERGLAYVNLALDHTPTLIELYLLKGKLQKHVGDINSAVVSLDEAQSLDTADRYINSKCAKYMLRANLIPEAEVMCGKFTREGSTAVENLNEMQCMWFEIECARSHKRMGKLGDALKKCHEIDKHFTDVIEDQFDFHTYCIRKMTLSSYISLLRLEDILRRHPFYYQAAKCAIKVYLKLNDHPFANASNTNGAAEDANETSEMKKQKRKQKKAAAKAEKEKEQQRQQAAKEQAHKSKTKDKEEEEAVQTADEFDPTKLVKTESPLDEATKFFEPLLRLSCSEVFAYVLGFEIYYRKRKTLLMLHCLKKAKALDSSFPQLHVCLVKFLTFWSSHSNNQNETVCQIVQESMPVLYSTHTDVRSFHETFKSAFQNSLPHRIAIAQCDYILGGESQQSDAITYATSLNQAFLGFHWKVCRRLIKRMHDGSFGVVSTDTVESYRARCASLFPHCIYFNAAEQKPFSYVSLDQQNVVKSEE